MFIARAVAIFALLGAAAPAAAENLHQLQNGTNVMPADPKDEEDDLCSGVIAGILRGIDETTLDLTAEQQVTLINGITAGEVQVNQYVVNKDGKGKYTCNGKGFDFDGMASVLGLDLLQGPILSGLKLKNLCSAFLPEGCVCNPADPKSYDWKIEINPSGNIHMSCNFDLSNGEQV